MSKLSFLLAVVALLLGGCAGQAGGPEVFEIRTEYLQVADQCSAAANRINSKTDEIEVTVTLLSPIVGRVEQPNAHPYEGAGSDPTHVTVKPDGFGDPALYVGKDATIDAVEQEIAEWAGLVGYR